MAVIFDDERKLATIELIEAVIPIEGADNIESVRVRGWNVVVAKGQFEKGMPVVYFEVDTALPIADDRFAFLAARGTKSADGIDYHVLRTIKLRKTISQGLVLPITDFPNILEYATIDGDVTALLKLGKWESDALHGANRGNLEGGFLTKYANKTDSERVQNLKKYWERLRSYEWYATEKIDGTSCTVVLDEDGNYRVMSRNFEVKDGDNIYWNAFRAHMDAFELLGVGEAVQFEIAGPGIQGNPLGLKNVEIFVFDYIRNHEPVARMCWPWKLIRLSAPIVPEFDLLRHTAEGTLEAVDKRTSTAAKFRGLETIDKMPRKAEGIVWHLVEAGGIPELHGRSTFKAVSNDYILKHEG